MAKKAKPRVPRQPEPTPAKRKRPPTPEHPSSPLAHEWKSPKINRVKALHDWGVSRKDIYHKEGVPVRTQYDMIHGPERRRGKSSMTNRGGKSKIDKDTVKKMIKHIEGHYDRRTWDWEELREEFKLQCVWETVRTTMNKAGYHKCRACQKSWINADQALRRRAFSDEHKNWPDWMIKRVHWSDELHFHQNSRHTEFVIRNEKERNCPDCTQKRRRTATTQISAWGMIGWNYKSDLKLFRWVEEVDKEFKNGRKRLQNTKFGGSMTQEIFSKDILPIVYARKCEIEDEHINEGVFIFQEDNDGSHGTRSQENIARYTKDEMELDYIDNWPAYSPDLNPIENVWRILKSRVKLRHCKSYQELENAIYDEWAKITYDEINECILGSTRGPNKGKGGAKGKDCHWRARLEQCSERNGLSTEF